MKKVSFLIKSKLMILEMVVVNTGKDMIYPLMVVVNTGKDMIYPLMVVVNTGKDMIYPLTLQPASEKLVRLYSRLIFASI